MIVVQVGEWCEHWQGEYWKINIASAQPTSNRNVGVVWFIDHTGSAPIDCTGRIILLPSRASGPDGYLPFQRMPIRICTACVQNN